MLWVVPLLVVGASPDVVVCPPEDPGVAARIRGQLADLDADVAWPEVCPSPTAPTIVVEGRPTDGYRIVFEAPERAPRARRIDALASVSATREAAAVAVRSVVKAILMGLEPAWAETPPPPPVETEWETRVSAAFEAQGTGLADPALAAAVRAGVRIERWLLEVGGTFGLPRTLEDDLTSIALREHAVWGAVGFRVWKHERWSATAGARGGVTLGRRRTRVRGGAAATPEASSVGGLVGAELRGAVEVTPGVSLELLGGADGVFGAPRLLYDTPQGPEVRASGWLVRPRAAILVTIETGGDDS